MSATKAELRREIAELRRVGEQLANVAYNYGRSPLELDEHGRARLRQLQEQWDGIKPAEPRGGR